jgi:hypothetical protein
MSVIKQPRPFSQQIPNVLNVEPNMLSRFAVLEHATTILVNLPEHRLGVSTLHGSGELSLFVG